MWYVDDILIYVKGLDELIEMYEILKGELSYIGLEIYQAVYSVTTVLYQLGPT